VFKTVYLTTGVLHSNKTVFRLVKKLGNAAGGFGLGADSEMASYKHRRRRSGLEWGGSHD
jgi:hypothetical protein